MDSTIRVAEVPASRGVAWLKESFRLFLGAPLVWLGLCAGWMTITLGLIVIPLVGGVIANFIQPVFFASFAIAAFKQLAGEPIVMGDLFTGFRRNVRSLINLGALLLLLQIAIFALMALLGLPMNTPSDRNVSIAEYLQVFEGKEWILAVGFLLTVLVKGALWFAPPLIAFHGMSTMHAIRWSLYACLSNLGAMVLYGVVLMVIFVLGLIPWALGLLVVIPVMAISTFIGYRDVFERGQTPISTESK
jgi:membrane-anchored glycerophosphoryl diester phosphodiesterase (GDPDase)